MKNFKVVAKLYSDTGIHTLRFQVCILITLQSDLVQATEKAVEMICKSQRCPESAIKDLKLTPVKD